MSLIKFSLKKRWMKTKFYIACLFMHGGSPYLKKHHIFKEMGDYVLYQPHTLPNEPKLIKIHNNVRIAADVTFYTHDVINQMFSQMDRIPYDTHGECIEIHDNVFIGGHSIILGNVSIGPNSIVAAGSVVTKDVKPGCIVGGNPAKVIGSFNEIHQRRKKMDGNSNRIDPNDYPEEHWKIFYTDHNKN